MTYRILITGSRTWKDWRTMRDALAPTVAEHHGNVTIREGCADGADRLAERIARQLGTHVEHRPANWNACAGPNCTPSHRKTRRDGTTYCPAAGVLRDAEMVDDGADECLAFIDPCAKHGCRKIHPHGSHGATTTANLAERAGIPTLRFPAPAGQPHRHRPALPRI